MLVRTSVNFTKESLRIHQYSSVFSILQQEKKDKAVAKIPIVKKKNLN